MAVAQQGRLGPAIRRPAASERFRTGLAPDAFDLAVLVAFAALSAWVLALDLSQVVAHDGVWAGTDGLFLPVDLSRSSHRRDESDVDIARRLAIDFHHPHYNFVTLLSLFECEHADTAVVEPHKRELLASRSRMLRALERD